MASTSGAPDATTFSYAQEVRNSTWPVHLTCIMIIQSRPVCTILPPAVNAMTVYQLHRVSMNCRAFITRSHYPILYPITDIRAVCVVSLADFILMNIYEHWLQ